MDYRWFGVHGPSSSRMLHLVADDWFGTGVLRPLCGKPLTESIALCGGGGVRCSVCASLYRARIGDVVPG